MGAVSYKIKDFDPEEAASGALCIVTSTSVDEDSSITPDATWNEIVTVDGQTKTITHNTVVGTGICRRSGNQFVITIGSTNYMFKTDGNGYSVNAKDKYIYLCEVNDTTQVEGNTTVVTQYVSIDADGKITRGSIAPNADKGYSLDELNARDEFAAQALRGILARIDNPSVLSENEIQFYCEAAYKWADKMILETAKRRVLGVGTNSGGGEGGGDNITVNNTYTTSEDLLKKIAENIEHLDISVEAGDTTVDIDTDGLIKALTGKDNKESVDTGDDVASKLDYIVRGLIGKDVNDNNIAEFKSLLESLDTMSDPYKGVPIRNYEDDEGEPLPLKMQVENTIDQDTPNPFIVASTVVNAKGSNNRTIPLAVSASIDSIDMPGGDANSPLYVSPDRTVSGKVAIVNAMDEDNSNKPIPVKVDGIQWTYLGKFKRRGADDDYYIDIPCLANNEFVKIELYSGDDVQQDADTTMVDYQRYKQVIDENGIYDHDEFLEESGNHDSISLESVGYISITDLPETTHIRLRAGGQGFGEGEYLKIYVAGNVSTGGSGSIDVSGIELKLDALTGSKTKDRNVTFSETPSINVSEQVTSRTVKGGGGNDAANFVNVYERNPKRDVSVAKDWVLLGEYKRYSNDNCIDIPCLAGNSQVKIEYYDSNDTKNDADTVKCDYVRIKQYYDSDLNLHEEILDNDFGLRWAYLSAIGYIQTSDQPETNLIRIRRSNQDFAAGDYLKIYVAGNSGAVNSSVNVSGGGSGGGGSTDVSGIVTALGNLTGSKTKDRTISTMPSLSGSFNVSEQNRNRSVSFTSGTSLNVSIPNTVRTDTDSLVNGCIIFGNHDNYGIEPRTNSYGHIGLDNKRFNEIFGETITCDVLNVGDKDQNSQTYFNVNQAGQVKATEFKVTGGTAAGFLKANGSIDTTMYLPASGTATNSAQLGGVVAANYIQKTSDSSYVLLANGNTKALTDFLEKSGGTVTDTIRMSQLNKLMFGYEDSPNYIQFDANDDALYFHGGPDGYIFETTDSQGDANFRCNIYANNVNNNSDARLKNIVSHAGFEVDKLAEMPLVKFTWKSDKKKRGQFGTIAQEWQKVIPELVSENGDGMLAMDYGAAAMAAGITACREIVKMKEEMETLKKENEYLKKELEAIKEIVYGKEKDDMED